MAYTLNYSISLGGAKIGLNLGAQLIDSDGLDVGALIIADFTEIGNGNYLWHYESFPNNFRGGIKFYDQLDLVNVLSFTSINPEEAEYTDVKVSSIETPEELTINVGHSDDPFSAHTGVIYSDDQFSAHTGVI